MWVNDIASNTGIGFHSNDCGSSGVIGADYWGVVGSVANNAMQESDGFCSAAIDAVGMGVYNLTAGTHWIAYGDFSYANVNTAGCRTMFRTLKISWRIAGKRMARRTRVSGSTTLGFDADRTVHQYV